MSENKYQLFKVLPEESILDELENIFPIRGFRQKTIQFTKYDFENQKCLEKLKEFIPKLEKLYLPCKSKVFLKLLNFKKSITILRQILRVFGYKLQSKEKFVNYRKFFLYWIIYDKMLKEEDEKNYKRKFRNVVFFD